MRNRSKDKMQNASRDKKVRAELPAKKVQTTNKNINKVIPKPKKEQVTKVKVQKKVSRVLPKKNKDIKSCSWGKLPSFLLMEISHFSSKSILEILKMSHVCSIWRGHITGEQGYYYWSRYKDGESLQNFNQMKNYLKKFIVEQQQKMSLQFEKRYVKLFNYGSTKQNIANKLIQKLGLEMHIQINKKPAVKQPYKLRTFNFGSYLFTKIESIKDFKYDFYTPHNMFKDNIYLTITFKSIKYKVSHTISKKYCPQDIAQKAIKQKAFNYFLDKNIVFTYFEGDNHFLYLFFQISAIQLVHYFRNIIQKKHQQSLQKQKKKTPLYKQLCETEFQDFVQYVKYQADFEIHLSYHNSIKQIFNHCNTKVYPLDYDRKHAYFDVKIEDSFEKVATYKLDNKMGMSQSVKDLYLLDFVLKDRDRFLIIFSGFIYARCATQKQREGVQNYFQFSENEMKILQFKGDKYDIKILIIEETKRNFMKNIVFNLYP